MTTQEELETEAAELYPESLFIQFGDRRLDPHETRFITAGKRTAHIRAKTITAEQVEKAAEAMFWGQQDMQENTWHDLPDSWKDEYRSAARAALTAAGFHVEGEDRDD